MAIYLAYETAVEAQTCHDIMTKLYKLALNLGKRVRSETGIGADSVSLSTTAFKAASMNIEDFSSSSVVVLGAGEMAGLISHYLVEARAVALENRDNSVARSKTVIDVRDALGFGVLPVASAPS